MTDWADEIDGRNWGIKRRTDSHHLMDLILSILPMLVLAGVPFFHSWVRSQMVDMGYHMQRLQSEEESLLRAEKAYLLEEAILKNPQRIDEIARADLGMSPIQPNQLIAPRVPDVSNEGTTILAMMSATPAAARASKAAASN